MNLQFIIGPFLIFFTTLVCHGQFEPAPVIDEDESLFQIIDNAYEQSIKSIPKEFDARQTSYLIKQYYERKKFSKEIVKSGYVINSGKLFDFVDSLRNVVLAANPDISREIKVYPIRDLSPNAFTPGDNIVYLHLGLLYRLESIEQVIYIICHEMAHNTLEHNRLRNEKYADEVRNDSISREYRRRLFKVYGRVTALNELMLPYIMGSMEFSRNNEFQADSLAMVYVGNLGLDRQSSLETFKYMENFTHERDTVWVSSTAFSMFNSCGNEASKIENSYKGSSIKKQGLIDKNEDLKESLRTHPYEKDRLEKLCSDFNLSCDSLTMSNSFQSWKYQVENEMIYQSFSEGYIARAIFYLFQNNARYVDYQLSQDLLPLCFAVLGMEKNRRKETECLGWMSEQDDKIYSDFYYYLRKMTPEQCMETAKCMSANMSNGIYKQYYESLMFAYNKDFESFKVHYQDLKGQPEKLKYFEILQEEYIINKVNFK